MVWNGAGAASGPCEGHQGDAARLSTEVTWWENRRGINWKTNKGGGNKVTKDLRKDFFPVKRIKLSGGAQGGFGYF